MSAGEWIGVGVLCVPPTLAGIGVIYRAGQLTRSVSDLAEQVTELRQRVQSLEDWIRGRPSRR